MPESEFVRVAIFSSETESLTAKTVLEENQIETKISGQEPSALGISLDGDDEIELFVRQTDFARAKELIESIEEEDAEPLPAWKCACGADVDEGFFVCWSCGAEFKE